MASHQDVRDAGTRLIFLGQADKHLPFFGNTSATKAWALLEEGTLSREVISVLCSDEVKALASLAFWDWASLAL